MTGTLQTKNLNGREYFYIVLSFKDPASNRWKTKWLSTGLEVTGNKKKAQKLLTKTLERYRGLEVPSVEEDMLFSDYLKKWLSQKKNQDIELSTWEGYCDHLKHAITYFSVHNIKLKNLKPADIKNYYEFEKLYGKVNKRDGSRSPLATRTIRSQKNLISAALQQAVEEDIIVRNPAFGIKISNKKNKDFRKHEVFLTQDEVQRLLLQLSAHNEPLRYLIELTLYYGLRRSEVLGLKWDAIDFEHKTVQIVHTVVKHKTLVQKDHTKTASSYRTYPLLPNIEPLLLAVRKNQGQNCALFKDEYIQTDYVFTWENGKPYSPDYISKKFKKIAISFGKPDMRFHDLRHSCASLLHSLGYSPKEIQDWLGHADFYTTMNIYTHIEKQNGAQSMEKLNDLIKLEEEKNAEI